MEDRIGFRPDRIRLGEWIIGVSSLLLLIDLIVLPWFAINSTFKTTVQLGNPGSATGWQSFDVIGPLVIVTCLIGLATWYLQGSQPSPAVPVCMTVITTVFGLLSALGLLIRVVFSHPTVLISGTKGVDYIHPLVWAVVGLFLSFGLVAGAWISLREDGVQPKDAPRRIETLRLTQRSA
ncbi:MAG: hypothetical protein J2O48_11815 [Solirubrobacterales bacterium]|nr:hypothetical protein [Solirubrobacterales bacterium]